MALTQYTADTDIIETLGTNPEDRPTLTDDTFKAKFDENSENIKVFLNAMIAELLSTANGKGASQIGIEDSGSKFTATNVESALAESAILISTNDGKLTTHKAEVVSKAVTAIRDISTTMGTQKIFLPFHAKSLQIQAVIGATKASSIGICDSVLAQSCVTVNPNDGLSYVGATVLQIYTSAYIVSGTVSLIEDDGFTITWAKVSGTVPGGTTVNLLALASTH